MSHLEQDRKLYKEDEMCGECEACKDTKEYKKKKEYKKYKECEKAKEVPKLIGGDVYAHQLTQEQFNNYVKSMKGVLADGTLRTFLSRVATMFKWAGSEGYAKPKIKWRKFEVDVSDSPIRSRKFKDKELDKLLSWLKNESKRGRHNYYRLLCCSELGLRIGEVCSIRLDNIDIDEKSLQVSRLKKKEKVDEELRMTDFLTDELSEYISTLPEDQTYLFQGKTGKAMTAGSEWFRRACAACDLDTKKESLVLHSARSKFIMDQLDEGQPFPKIMGSVGHSSSSTTLRYLRIAKKEGQIEAVELANKRRVVKTVEMKQLEKKNRELAAENARLREEMESKFKGMDVI